MRALRDPFRARNPVRGVPEPEALNAVFVYEAARLGLEAVAMPFVREGRGLVRARRGVVEVDIR